MKASFPGEPSSSPAISVVLCNYNHARYLRQCFAGILRQTFSDFEFIITDDGSTDGSQEIIRELAAKDRRVRINLLEKNVGVMAAVELTMKMVRGRLLYSEASDDFLIDAKFFENAITAIEAHPESAGYYAVTGLLSNERNQVCGAMGSAPHEGYLPPQEFYPGFLRGQVFVPGSSAIWRMDCLAKLGGYDYALGPQIDFLINHALPCQHGVVFSRLPVKVMRTYDKPISYSSNASIWAQAARFARVEERLREIAPPYSGFEQDWVTWRGRTIMEAVHKSGAQLN